MEKINKKGFTLIEMMAILILLALILLVAIPNITNTIKKDKVNQLEKYEETLCDAALAYIVNKNVHPTEIDVTLLVSENYVADNLKNPQTKELAINDDLQISYDANNKISCHLK